MTLVEYFKEVDGFRNQPITLYSLHRIFKFIEIYGFDSLPDWLKDKEKPLIRI